METLLSLTSLQVKEEEFHQLDPENGTWEKARVDNS